MSYRPQNKSNYDNSIAPTVMSFGKHKGKKITDVAATDANYLRWVLANLDGLNAPTKTAIKLALMSVVH